MDFNTIFSVYSILFSRGADINRDNYAIFCNLSPHGYQTIKLFLKPLYKSEGRSQMPVTKKEKSKESIKKRI